MTTFGTNFTGYSSIGTSFANPVMTGIKLAAQDLLNHFNTRRGERVMMPEFGSIIWELLFDPLDARTTALIEHDVQTVINNDPRWNLIDTNIADGPNALTISVRVVYLPSTETVTLPLIFDKGTATV